MPNTNPTFYGDGHTPRRTDTKLIVLQKILGATIDGGGGGGTNNVTGSGSPIGVVTPDYVGQFYIDTASPYNVWFSVGLTNADWILETGNITP